MLAKKIFAPLVAILSIAAAGLVSAQAPTSSTPYSAIAVHQLPGQPETFGTIVKSGQNLRLEFEENGRHVIQILLPSVGAMYILDPTARTFVEVLGPAVPATNVEGYVSPCPNQKPSSACQNVGKEVLNGLTVERWALSSDQEGKPLVILWNSERRKALRQDFPNGGNMIMAFVAMEDHGGRPTEHWTIRLSLPNQEVQNGDWWYDPQLRVVVRENLPSGELRRLDNITLGPVDPALFQVPQGWRKTEPQAAAPQRPRGE